MNDQGMVALLGRQDHPSDAVEDYCRYLTNALCVHGIDLQIQRVSWDPQGWPAALNELREKASEWRGKWVFVQYTALAWSARGFPWRFGRVLQVLRQAGARVAVVYHDAEPYAGNRAIDQIRRIAQLHSMRNALRLAHLAIFTIAVENVSWIRSRPANAVFIPVGANLPAPEKVWKTENCDSHRPPTIALYGITGGSAGCAEMACVWNAAEFLAKQVGKLRMVVFGRNSEWSMKKFQRLSELLPVEVQVLGFIPEEEVVRQLGNADVLLFVRGPISSRRGSAIAGIACGLPVVAFEGPETASPITDAGVVLLSTRRCHKELGTALLRVLTDRDYRASLAERSRHAQAQYFSWPSIAARYIEALEQMK